MVLTVYDWIYGIAELAAFFLAVAAALIAINMFKKSKKELMPWKYFLAALLLFSIWEINGALVTLGIIPYSLLNTAILPFILTLLIVSLESQIHIAKGWSK